MPEPVSIPPTFAVQALPEAPQQVRAHATGERVSLLFGDDVHGVGSWATATTCGG